MRCRFTATNCNLPQLPFTLSVERQRVEKTLVTSLGRVAAAAGTGIGPRSFSQLAVEETVRGLRAMFAFACVERAEADDLEVLGSAGLDAIAFRRLEQRAGRSALYRTLDLNARVDLLLRDEPSLEFLVTGERPELCCFPITERQSAIGLVAFAFDKVNGRKPAELEAAAEIIAKLIAAELRSQSESERDAAAVLDHERGEREQLRSSFDLSNIVGNSAAIREVRDRVSQVAMRRTPVLIRGEVGTGKHLTAGAVHYNSLRAKRPLTTVYTAGKTDALIESELFGAADGDNDRGTLVIDDVADLAMHLQLRLLELLDRRSNVRIIAITKRDLEAEILDGTFRDDLFYRINPFTVHLPPLRDRRPDILLLAEHFVEVKAKQYGKRISRISTPAIDMLSVYHFPGNIRELENVIERAVANCDGGVIHARHLPPTIQTAEQSGTAAKASLDDAIAQFERDMISDALKSSRGNIAKAARLLGSTERVIGYKIRNLAIDARRFKG